MTRSEGNRLWTEGPWKAFYKHKYDEWHVAIPYSDGSFLCPLASDGITTPDPSQREATANLIAAAPRLYETLDVLLNCLDREAVARLGIEQEVLAAVCALQQARGETND
jgi:hypothetical protein